MIAFMTIFHVEERQEKKCLLSAAENNTQDLLRHGVSDTPILSYVFSYVVHIFSIIMHSLVSR